MRINNPKREELKIYFENLDTYIQTKGIKWIKYIDLGCKIIRLINFSDKFTPHVEKQLAYSLKNNAPKYDATVVIFQDDFEGLTSKISDEFNPKINLRLRIELIYSKKKELDLSIFDDNYSKHNPILNVNPERGFLNGYDISTNTYYYGVKNLDPEEFIKEGHIFVQIFNQILKTENTNMVHGAVVGLNDKGILFCARGQRGKSTLAVLSMMKGFEYVSDDYLVLEKEGENLYSYPVYSIITLSPRMYNELYNELEGTRFVSNNARKDKYVINIANYHHTFKSKYPISVCMFPEIVPDLNPSIKPCTNQEKGRAITHLVHSTINQMHGKHDIKTIQKLINMVKDFEFYKINLCPDIYKNVECLREFTLKLNNKEKNNDKLCIK